VDAVRHQVAKGIIYEAVACDPAKALEARARDRDAEVAPLAGAGVPDVEMAVVVDRERFGGELGAQRALYLGGADAH